VKKIVSKTKARASRRSAPPCSVSRRKGKQCPYCGSRRIIVFTADDDICQDCNKWFSGT
jgi:DNA-directed RNA polymerase subunit RPC12/RpoP